MNKYRSIINMETATSIMAKTPIGIYRFFNIAKILHARKAAAYTGQKIKQILASVIEPWSPIKRDNRNKNIVA